MTAVYSPPERDDCAAHRIAEAREEAFTDGYCAGRQGLAFALNPYPHGESGYLDWCAGWHKAMRERVAVILRERSERCE